MFEIIWNVLMQVFNVFFYNYITLILVDFFSSTNFSRKRIIFVSIVDFIMLGLVIGEAINALTNYVFAIEILVYFIFRAAIIIVLYILTLIFILKRSGVAVRIFRRRYQRDFSRKIKDNAAEKVREKKAVLIIKTELDFMVFETNDLNNETFGDLAKYYFINNYGMVAKPDGNALVFGLEIEEINDDLLMTLRMQQIDAGPYDEIYSLFSKRKKVIVYLDNDNQVIKTITN